MKTRLFRKFGWFCVPLSIVLTAFLTEGGLRHLHAGELEVIRTNLQARVGGTWQIETNGQFAYVRALTLPAGLKGNYCVFSAETNRPALEQATNWMANSQAPFFILGTNADCVAVTYIPRSNAVSRAVVEALRLSETRLLSPIEAGSLRRQ